MPAADPDLVALTALLGRKRHARAFEVAVRDEAGAPVVIRNAPLLDDGTPMPTRYWLVDPVLVTRVARLESAGGVRAAEAAVEPSELLPRPRPLRRRTRRRAPRPTTKAPDPTAASAAPDAA